MPTSRAVSLDDLTPHQLVAEIQQISLQYRQEVSTIRRTWPTSIRDRVHALQRLGVNSYKIAKLSGIPYSSVLLWSHSAGIKPRGRAARRKPEREIKQEAQFIPITGIDTAACGTATAASRKARLTTAEPTTAESREYYPRPSIAGLIVTLPGGFEIRGFASMGEVVALYQAIGHSS